jgi:hypothetical protein
MLNESQTDSNTHVLSVVLVIAPALVGAGINWLHDNSKSTRRSQLADRLLAMMTAYCAQNPGTDGVLMAAHTALGNEIGAICNELSTLQTDSQRTSRRTGYGWLSDAFLLYWPKGFFAWVVHLVFYFGLLFLLFGMWGYAISSEVANASDKVEDWKFFLPGSFFFGLVLFGLQRLAIWLRGRRQV